MTHVLFIPSLTGILAWQLPPGYAEACLKRGKISEDGKMVELTDDVWVKLQIEFKRGHRPVFNPVPVADWPAYISLVSAQRLPTDTGAGDTVERVVGPFGSPEWRQWAKEALGVFAPSATCNNCASWKPIWNQQYPYSLLTIQAPEVKSE